MKLVVLLACMLSLACSLPSEGYGTVEESRVFPDAEGRYSFDFETTDGKKRSETGAPLSEAEGAVGAEGSYSYTHPGGLEIQVKYVADLRGYQPEFQFIHHPAKEEKEEKTESR